MQFPNFQFEFGQSWIDTWQTLYSSKNFPFFILLPLFLPHSTKTRQVANSQSPSSFLYFSPETHTLSPLLSLPFFSIATTHAGPWSSNAVDISLPSSPELNALLFAREARTSCRDLLPLLHRTSTFIDRLEHFWNPHSKSFSRVPILPSKSHRKIGTFFLATATFWPNSELSQWINPGSMIHISSFSIQGKIWLGLVTF